MAEQSKYGQARIDETLRAAAAGTVFFLLANSTSAPPSRELDLGSARIVVTNFHAFQRKQTGDAGGLTKQ